MVSQSASVPVEVEGRILTLSNLDKVLYSGVGFTKGEVIDYYSRVAPALLPHLADRPLTRKRWPDGIGGQSFYEKNRPRGTPEWVRTVTLPTPESTLGHEEIAYVVVDGLPTLVWLANLAALELHVPQWRVGPQDGVGDADLLVLDLDPGPPAGLLECVQAALLLREALAADGLPAYVKTSGSKGLQLYAPIRPTSSEQTAVYAKALATQLTRMHPKLLLADMARARRRGKVFLDWSQNSAAKTTVAAYSLRGRERPTVSTPVTWDELERCDHPDDLAFGPADVLARLDDHGDLFADLNTPDPSQRQPLPDP